ncbi:MAG: hypothetical protein J6Y30_14830 [Treponema sp.]|nr:hypothetical protein [Treponema sp.]
MENVFEKDGFVYLKTGLSPDEFSKARGGTRIAENGSIAIQTSAGWVFSAWRFEETEEDNGLIFVKGRAFSGQTLKDYFCNDSSNSFSAVFPSVEFAKAKSARAAALVCSVMEASVNQNVSLPNSGAGGIFISDDFTKVLFFPEQIFIQAALRFESSGKEEEFGQNRAFYVHPTLAGTNAIRFTQSVIAYRALTGEFPFFAKNQEELSLDMADKNFVPLRNKIWAVDEQLASFVDNSLSRSPILKSRSRVEKIASLRQTALSDLTSGRTASPLELTPLFPVSSLYRELGLTKDGSIPQDGRLLSVIRKSSLSPEDFELAVKKETEKNARQVKAKRFFRKYKKLLVSLAIAIVLSLAAAFSLRKSYMSRPTTRGLSAFQTVELFYSAYNMLDLNKARCTILGKQPDYLVDIISQAYVTNQTRSAYSPAKKTVSPAEWMNYNNNGNYYMFGLTGFAVNEQKMELFAKPPLRKENPTPVSEDLGKRIKEGDFTECYATYFFVYPEADMGELGESVNERFHIEEYCDKVRLVFRDECWRIVEISQNKEREFFQDSKAFYDDYKRLFDANSKDVLLTANELRTKYGWIPENSEILSAAQKMREEFHADELSSTK